MAIDSEARAVEDKRSDAEILAELQNFNPVDANSEKNIWGFWKQGLSKCPAWEQRNVVSWVRRCSKEGWTVRILDMVEGSPNNSSKYIPDEYLPEAFRSDSLAGPYSGPGSSDVIRLPLLYLYGGVYLDVTFTLYRSLDNFVWDALVDPERPEEMATMRAMLAPTTGMGNNGFVASRKGCKAILYWHEIYLQLWTNGRNSTIGAHAHPLLHHLPPYVPPVPNMSHELMKMSYQSFHDYQALALALERLRHMVDRSRNWDGPAYFKQNKALLLNIVTEAYWGQKLTMWDGSKQFEYLLRKREGAGVDTESAEWKEAEEYVQGVLGMSSAQKLSHGIITTGSRPWLATLWDKPENADCDNQEGSFGAYLRDAAIYYEQKKPVELCSLPYDARIYLEGDILTTAGERFDLDSLLK